MSDIYVFSGACGCGKTTLANRFAAQHAKGCSSRQVYVIHGDDLHRGFVESGAPHERPLLGWPEILRFNWDGMLMLADNALKRGLDVILDYVVEDELPMILQLARAHGSRVFYVVLTASEEAIRDRLTRRGDGALIERSLYLNAKLRAAEENQGRLYDVTALSPDEMLSGLDVAWFIVHQP